MGNLSIWERKIHSKIHYINGYEYIHVFLVQQPELNILRYNNNKRETQELQNDSNKITSTHKDFGNQRLIPTYKFKINKSTTYFPNISSNWEDFTVRFTKSQDITTKEHWQSDLLKP